MLMLFHSLSRDVKNRLDSGYVDSIDTSTKSKNQYGEFIRTVTLTFIGEPNLCRCIFQSKKAVAKRFQDWVFKTKIKHIPL